MDYLYELEYMLYQPNINYTKNGLFTEQDRQNIIFFLYNLNDKFSYNNINLQLAITLFDTYCSLITEDEPYIYYKGISCMCLNLADAILNNTCINLKDYSKECKLSVQSLKEILDDIVEKLDGTIIRPSTIFFVNTEIEQKLSLISYFQSQLMIYKPSIIADAIYYLINGTTKIYSFNEISVPCALLCETITQMCTTELTSIAKNCEQYVRSIDISTHTLHVTSSYHSPHKLDYIITEYMRTNYSEIYKVKCVEQVYVLKQLYNDNFKELACLKLLNHKNIITLKSFKVTNKINLIFEIGQFNLSDGISKGLLDVVHMLKYFTDITLGIKYCHEHDVIHGDLKPDNIMWFSCGNLKIIDFGDSVPYASVRPYLPIEVQTPLYRAPEILMGKSYYDNKIDIWSIGLIFYFMITKDTLLDQVEKYEDLLPTILSIFGEDISLFHNKVQKYQDIVMPCVKLDPTDRVSASDLLKVINNYSYLEY